MINNTDSIEFARRANQVADVNATLKASRRLDRAVAAHRAAYMRYRDGRSQLATMLKDLQQQGIDAKAIAQIHVRERARLSRSLHDAKSTLLAEYQSARAAIAGAGDRWHIVQRSTLDYISHFAATK